MESGFRIFIEYIKAGRKTIAAGILFVLIFALVFRLSDAPLDAVLYAFLLCAFFLAIFAVFDFRRFFNTHRRLYEMRGKISVGPEGLPEGGGLLYRDCRELLEIVSEEKREAVLRAETERTEALDYYTLWAHQIKTPISAMRLFLQAEKSETNSLLLLELFKTEQYVNMVMQYLRLSETVNDLVLREYLLSDIVKQAIRKYAQVFIQKKLTLCYTESPGTVLTDEKWLVFVIEQLLSNALKYTPPGGKISVYSPSPQTLAVEDNGVGIAPEDLPRVFERGFTGYNGRMDKRATGIGLYLCKKIMNKLSHKISISSVPGKGTKVLLALERDEIPVE